MSVIDVWGLVSGKVVGLITRNADEWYFDLPSDASGTLMAEFWAEDGAIVQGGVMRIGEDGHSVSFRFEPQAAGMMTISVQWVMDVDRWQERFLINVRA